MIARPLHSPKIDPNDLIQEIEDDPMSQLAWSLGDKVSKTVRQLDDMLQATMSTNTESSASTTAPNCPPNPRMS